MTKCNNIQEKLIDYIDKNLPKEEVKLVENHINSCSKCAKELAEIQEFLDVIALDVQENPSGNIRLNFEKKLSKEKEKLNGKTNIISLNEAKKSNLNQNWKSFLRIAASILLVVSAFFIGKYQSNINLQTANQTTKKEKKILAMLNNQLASKRIQAIDLSEKVNNPNNKIIEALISRLFNDENTNVRLASAEALAKFSSSETVRNALIKALETDIKPTVQIELIQILAKIQEKRALKPMKKLLEKKETPKFLKQQLQQNIASLL